MSYRLHIYDIDIYMNHMPFIDKILVEAFCRETRRRQHISSTQHFVDTTFCRQNILSTEYSTSIELVNSTNRFSPTPSPSLCMLKLWDFHSHTAGEWRSATCTCPSFLKNYICKHIIGMSIRLKYCKAPPEAKNVSIGTKRKRGRPSKAKKALVTQ